MGTDPMLRMTFSHGYLSPIRCAVICLVCLSLWCAFVLDMGESFQAFLHSLAAYVALLLLIMLRRPASPSKLDLLLVGWALPLLFFTLLLLFPLVWHLRGLD